MRWSVLVLLCLASTLMVAQESPLAAELRREGERASDDIDHARGVPGFQPAATSASSRPCAPEPPKPDCALRSRML